MNKKLKNKKLNTNKGITLIALIITIIVLLILAEVAIRAVTGNGILGYAKNARYNYEAAQTNEQETLQSYTDYIENELGTKPNSNEGEEILTVELKLDEANVTKDKATIQVTKVTNTKTNEEVTSGLQYTYSIEEQDSVTDTNNTHNFTNLDQTKSYTINVKATDENENYGESSVKVISFSLKGSYYFRCQEGLTWEYFCNSEGYNPTRVQTKDWTDGGEPQVATEEYWDFYKDSSGEVRVRGKSEPLDNYPDYDTNGKFFEVDYNIYLKDVTYQETIDALEYDWYKD